MTSGDAFAVVPRKPDKIHLSFRNARVFDNRREAQVYLNTLPQPSDWTVGFAPGILGHYLRKWQKDFEFISKELANVEFRLDDLLGIEEDYPDD